MSKSTIINSYIIKHDTIQSEMETFHIDKIH